MFKFLDFLKRKNVSNSNQKIGTVNMASSSTVTINGVTYVGDKISILNNSVIMSNGDVVSLDGLREINIHIAGDVSSLDMATGNVTVDGDVTELSLVSGDARVTGQVHGDVSTVSGDVTAEAITGDVSTVSGDIKVK